VDFRKPRSIPLKSVGARSQRHSLGKAEAEAGRMKKPCPNPMGREIPPRSPERSMPLSAKRSMDAQTKREIWLLALGTIIVEVPVAFAAFAVLSH
jgi:hypothetical protein